MQSTKCNLETIISIKHESFNSILSNFIFLIVFVFLSNSLNAQNTKAKSNYDTTKTLKGDLIEYVISYPNSGVKEIIRLKDSIKHGIQEVYYNDGKLSSKIEYKLGNLHGKYLLFDIQGNLKEKKEFKYSSKRKHSLLDGDYEIYRHKILILKTSYRDSLLHGEYAEYFTNGDLLIQARYKKGLLIGKKEKYSNSRKLLSRTNYLIIKENGKKKSVLHGEATYFDYNGNITKAGNYTKGKKDGVWTKYRNNKVVSEYKYKNDIKYGEYKEYYQDGALRIKGILYERIKIGNKVNTYVFDGQRLSYYKNGNIEKRESFDMGKKTGVWEIFYDNGTLKERHEYKDNLLTGKKIYWNANGNKFIEIPYKIINSNGKDSSVKHGTEYRWKNNVLVLEVEFVNGIMNGTKKEYHRNGQLAMKATIIDGLGQGKSIEYHENGKIKNTKNYYSYYDKSGRTKTCYVNWRVNYDKKGKYLSKYFADSAGNILISKTYYKGQIIELDFKNILKLNYFPNGKLLSIKLYSSYYRIAHAQYYYLSGKLRKLSFQNPEKFVLNHINYADNGEIISTYSDIHGNPDSMQASLETAKKYAQSVGTQSITNKFYTDTIKNGTYTLYYATGKKFGEMNFSNDLPNGKFIFFDPIKEDTLLFKFFNNGFIQGKFLEKFAGQNKIYKGEYFDNSKFKWVNTYKPTGIPKKKTVFDENAKRIVNIEYYDNGQIKRIDDKVKEYYATYDSKGFLNNETTALEASPGWTRNRQYYFGTKQLKRQEFYFNHKHDSTRVGYFASGTLQYRIQFKDGVYNGPYVEYDTSGNLKKSGEFINGKQNGLWLVYADSKIDSQYYKNGNLEVKQPTLHCSCIDTTLSYSKVKFMQTLAYMIEYSVFKKYLPDYIKPVDDLNYESIFYKNLYTSYNSELSFASLSLTMFKEFSVNIPADEQLKLTLNPCRIKGYLGFVDASVSYSSKNVNRTSLTLKPKRISIEFLKGPLESLDNNYKNFTAFFDVKSIEFRYSEEFSIELESKSNSGYVEEVVISNRSSEPNSNPCFVAGLIKNYLTIDIKDARPIVFENPTNSSYRQEVLKLGLSETETNNFFGIWINQADLSFIHSKNDVEYIIKASSKNILAGGKYVTGIIQIKSKKLNDGTYEVLVGGKTIQISKDELKLELLKKGFSRLKFDYNKDEQILNINFFTE
ncbi:MAG: hypothetical protein U9R42_10770 [Bacteroidota bacterium]|nr:hypothetical protein [Bacteroidota bacterium]